MFLTVPPTVFQAAPGLESCWPGLRAGDDSGTEPRREETAAADVVAACFDCLLLFSLAATGATVKATAVRVAAAIVSIEDGSCEFITILLAVNTAECRRIIQQAVCRRNSGLTCRIARICADCVSIVPEGSRRDGRKMARSVQIWSQGKV